MAKVIVTSIRRDGFPAVSASGFTFVNQTPIEMDSEDITNQMRVYEQGGLLVITPIEESVQPAPVEEPKRENDPAKPIEHRKTTRKRRR